MERGKVVSFLYSDRYVYFFSENNGDWESCQVSSRCSMHGERKTLTKIDGYMASGGPKKIDGTGTSLTVYQCLRKCSKKEVKSSFWGRFVRESSCTLSTQPEEMCWFCEEGRDLTGWRTLTVDTWKEVRCVYVSAVENGNLFFFLSVCFVVRLVSVLI